MAARLKYAGLEKIECESSIKEALEKTLDSCHNDERLYILPTYTSLLELEKLALN